MLTHCDLGRPGTTWNWETSRFYISLVAWLESACTNLLQDSTCNSHISCNICEILQLRACISSMPWCPFLSFQHISTTSVYVYTRVISSLQPHLRLCGVHALQTSHLERSPEWSHFDYTGTHFFICIALYCYKIKFASCLCQSLCLHHPRHQDMNVLDLPLRSTHNLQPLEITCR